jgi:uncharacterized protein (DUF1501 family)
MKSQTRTKENLLAAITRPDKISWPAGMPRMSFATENTDQSDTLVVIFLRGAADMLNIVVPYGEEAYYQARPTINIPRPDDTSSIDKTIDLDGFFGLHPSLSPLIDAWQDSYLGIIHAVGAPDVSRSHFKAMELMERGVEDETGPASGWIGRHLATLDTQSASPLRAIGLGKMVPRSLYGSVPATALRSITDYHLGGNPQTAQLMRNLLDTLYTGKSQIHQFGQETLKILDTISVLDPAGYQVSGDRDYPEGEFGSGLKQIAMLIKAEVGLEVAAIDLGGWDTHFSQGTTQGLLSNLVTELGVGLATFYADLNDQMNEITVVVMSEFGRRVKENASLGTDHGHGSAMFLLGGNVQGGVVHGLWPGLEKEQLFGPGDLAVTTDYRDVLAEVISRRLRNPAVDQIFPDYQISTHNFLKG